MPKIRVLIVDDSTVIRRLVTETLARDPDIEIVGTAPNGKIAIAKIIQTPPDIVTLDVEMPEMNGLEALKEIRKTHPKLPVIMFSTLTARGATTTLDALAAGASDYVTKPAEVSNISEAVRRLEFELLPKIKALCRNLVATASVAKFVALPTSTPTALKPATTRARSAPAHTGPIDVIAIGTSTGGPNALAAVFGAFPQTLDVPIVLVQHMPPLFTKMLAERLNGLNRLKFHEGEDDMPVEPGHVYIAPGGKHMEVRRPAIGGPVVLKLHEAPPENSCRPAVDVLFRSVASVYGARTLAIILTGMGQDGLRGCETIYEQGGRILAQDEATSVVWGMPGYVAQSGMADRVIPLDQVAQELVRRSKEYRSSGTTGLAPAAATPCR